MTVLLAGVLAPKLLMARTSKLLFLSPTSANSHSFSFSFSFLLPSHLITVPPTTHNHSKWLVLVAPPVLLLPAAPRPRPLSKPVRPRPPRSLRESPNPRRQQSRLPRHRRPQPRVPASLARLVLPSTRMRNPMDGSRRGNKK